MTEMKDEYTLWFHNPNDTNWNVDAYHEILNFQDYKEFWVLYSSLKNKLIENGMFFLMKSNIKPIWEDENNINGGCISYKVDKRKSYNIFEKFLVYLISGELERNNPYITNGISISPKKKFNIIKIWFGEEIDINQYNFIDELGMNKSNILYRSHKKVLENSKK